MNKETTKTTTPLEGVQLLDVRQLATTLGMHPRSIWRLAAMAEAGQGNFPRPLRIGPKTIRWRLVDVQAYLAALAGERAS
jgi:predicted DNA-binding transcriptional regulator AlpA